MLRSKSTSAPEMLKFHQRVTCRRQEEITGMSMKDGIRFDPKQWHICMQLEEEGTMGSRTQEPSGVFPTDVAMSGVTGSEQELCDVGSFKLLGWMFKNTGTWNCLNHTDLNCTEETKQHQHPTNTTDSSL
ncbi:hypothetical protein CesoFtcFv8_018137 [Champsocephalus esox]|uniref:Uncharacterized protein n=2 Tax=Champsocephalus TaxID=52236 RepID=A0AAN8D457_CHAGU|nr:hypothetical protein CesoFtcFv8_018137 [Champsocephalus esox]KAK5913383.1 hypothetical protein CgunFtcFv8_007921 [Champsocephalus gunnari]